MLKDLNTGKILKTKSEVSALQDFVSWLGRAKGAKEGVILICHEPERKVNHFDNDIKKVFNYFYPQVLVPLLLQALHKYALLPAFSKIVSGFVHSEEVIQELGDKGVITPLSLR